MAGQLNALKNRLDAFNIAFESLEKAVSEDQANQLFALYQTYHVAQKAANLAAGELFADEPLPDIGSESWRLLWEAARRYSEAHAYPDNSFPFTENYARCVLCQQKLDSEAIARLKRFERFVKDETKRKEQDAKDAYRNALDELTNANVPGDKISLVVALIRDELNDDNLADSVYNAAVSLKWRLRAILRKHTSYDKNVQYPMTSMWPSEFIKGHSTALLTRITALKTEDESEERKLMQTEFMELADREWLSVIQDDVVAEIERRKKRARLNEILKDTATNRITTKSDEIAQKLVTSALRAQFSEEIEKLGVAGLAIELRKERASYGVPHFRVRLTRSQDAPVGEILSEGEHRCVALAAFLAELATIESRSTIVFDDPVSSLDHIHREDVAKRLSLEAKHRQVIVFTHDIVFLFLLEQACRDINTHVAFRSVFSNYEYTGLVQQHPPMRAQSVEKVIESMQKQFDNEERHYQKGDYNKWEVTVDTLQKRLRWTWERAVEDAISPVLKRLSEKVQTKGLAKVTALTIEDCIQMRKAYGRCSSLLHSSADALNNPLPAPEKIQHELTELHKWITNIKRKQEQIELLE